MTSNLDHIRQLIATHQARKEDLEIRRATYGINSPPEINNEIDLITAEMAKLEASLTALETVEDLSSRQTTIVDRRSVVNYEHRLAIMVATVQATVAEVSSVKAYVKGEIEEFKRLLFKIVFAFCVLFVLWSLLFIVLSRGGYL